MTDVREVYSAEFADPDGKLKHTKVDYDKVSTFFAHSRGFKKDEEVTVELWEAVLFNDKDLKCPIKVKVDESGLIKCDIHWNKIPKIKTMRNVYAQVKAKEGKVVYDADGNQAKASVYLLSTPTITKIAGYKSAVVVGSATGAGGISGTCVCKDYDLIWGNKVSCDFRKKVVDVCKDLWPKNFLEMANGLMAVMNVETGGSFKAHQIMGKSIEDVKNITKDDFWLEKSDGTKTSRAVGLIQFTQDALVSLGEFKNGLGYDKLHSVKLKFAQMGEIKQLDYVKKYFTDSKDKIKSPEDIYLHVFAPTGVGKRNDYVLYDKDIDGEKYAQNKSVDKENNKDNKIQRSEILGRYNNSITSGKGSKADKFICGLINDTQTVEINKYKIEVDKFKYSKILKSDTSKKYQYDLYDSGILVKSIVLQKNEHNLLPFPETGSNWGRFGIRDTGGDNWVDEEVCAALFGFFYSLPKNDYSGTLYFNDISANDSRNIGHAGHKVGNDIDLRYPGSTNIAGAVLWSKAAESFSSKEKFIEVLENILSVGVKWGFNKNYAFEEGIKNTTGKATSIHKDHFHLGLR